LFSGHVSSHGSTLSSLRTAWTEVSGSLARRDIFLNTHTADDDTPGLATETCDLPQELFDRWSTIITIVGVVIFVVALILDLHQNDFVRILDAIATALGAFLISVGLTTFGPRVWRRVRKVLDHQPARWRLTTDVVTCTPPGVGRADATLGVRESPLPYAVVVPQFVTQIPYSCPGS
jgi:hypothetical protein